MTLVLPALEPGQRHAVTMEGRSRIMEELGAPWSPFSRINVRDSSETPDGSWMIEGHAAVFNQWTTLFELTDSLGTITVKEKIEPGAFTTALGQSDLLVHLNNGHDNKWAMASSKVNGIGGLRVDQDAFGLPYMAKVDPKVSYISDAGILLRSGVIDGASFKFTIAPGGETVEEDGSWDGDITLSYTITDINHLYDVCICAQGAYAQATSGIRNRMLGHTSPARGVDGGHPRLAEAAAAARRGVSTVDREAEAVVLDEERWKARHAQMRMRIRMSDTSTKTGD